MTLKTPPGPRCHKIWPRVQLATEELPKNLARVFHKTPVIFHGFHGPRGCFYLAKWQGSVASSFSRSFFRAFFTIYLAFIILTYFDISMPNFIELKGIKMSSPGLNGHFNPVFGKVIWRSG